MSQSGQQPTPLKVIKPPPIFKILLLLVGPGLLLVSLGMIGWIHFSLSEVADARIVSIEQSDERTGRIAYTPEFSWSFHGNQLQAFSQYASHDKREFNVGQTLEIRFHPDNPDMVSPNTFWSLYGFTTLTLPVSLALTLSMFYLYRRKK